MSWAYKQYIQNQLWAEFHFFKEGAGVVSESLDDNRLLRLGTIRFHLSTAFTSVEDLTIKISSIYGSRYNITLLSQAMLGVNDLFWALGSNVLPLLSGDQVVFAMSMAVGVNNWGLTVSGWSVQGV
jgi:hypothetical protein